MKIRYVFFLEFHIIEINYILQVWKRVRNRELFWLAVSCDSIQLNSRFVYGAFHETIIAALQEIKFLQ